MTVRVATNGLGRIGRTTLEIRLDTSELELIAANDLAKVMAWYGNAWGMRRSWCARATTDGAPAVWRERLLA
jgi:hypothetical protein